MEQYTVNGVAIAYDTFDLANLEAYEGENKRISELASQCMEEGTVAALSELCFGIKDFFDVLCGEGTSFKLFGERLNAKEITDSFKEFTAAVRKFSSDGMPGALEEGASSPSSSPSPMNREQRRAQERAERKAAYSKKAAMKRDA